MKTLSLLIVAFAFCFSASAQTMSDTGHHKMKNNYSQSRNNDHYMMKDGKLMMDKNGTMSSVDNDVTLSNGTTISREGKVTWKDGKTQTLKNGERVGSNGKVWGDKMNNSSSTHRMNNMRNKADSSRKH